MKDNSVACGDVVQYLTSKYPNSVHIIETDHSTYATLYTKFHEYTITVRQCSYSTGGALRRSGAGRVRNDYICSFDSSDPMSLDSVMCRIPHSLIDITDSERFYQFEDNTHLLSLKPISELPSRVWLGEYNWKPVYMSVINDQIIIECPGKAAIAFNITDDPYKNLVGHVYDNKLATIQSIVINMNARGKGIATQLIRMVDFFARHYRIRSDVYPDIQPHLNNITNSTFFPRDPVTTIDGYVFNSSFCEQVQARLLMSNLIKETHPTGILQPIVPLLRGDYF